MVDVKDTPPQFNKTLFAAGINFGDTIGYELTAITVSMELQLTLATEVTLIGTIPVGRASSVI